MLRERIQTKGKGSKIGLFRMMEEGRTDRRRRKSHRGVSTLYACGNAIII